MDFRQGEVLTKTGSQVYGSCMALPQQKHRVRGPQAAITMVAAGYLRMQLFKQHQVFDRVVLPGASHLLLATAAHLRLNENASALELTDTIFECRGAQPGLGMSVVLGVGSQKIRTNQR